jgi:hypothetical protein
MTSQIRRSERSPQIPHLRPGSDGKEDRLEEIGLRQQLVARQFGPLRLPASRAEAENKEMQARLKTPGLMPPGGSGRFPWRLLLIWCMFHELSWRGHYLRNVSKLTVSL